MASTHPPNTVSDTQAPPSNVFAKRMLTAVNFFVETNRLEPYTAVYLIQIMGWNEVSFGIVSLAMNMAMLIFQTPAGDLLDKTTKSKKIITALAVLVAAVTTVMVIWTSNFWIILVGKTIEGISATIFLPALMALLFGICKTEAEVPSFIASTEVSNKIGSFVIVSACAAITYYLFPDVEFMFYLLGAGGVAAAIFLLLIPEASIDHNKARQLGASSSESEDESSGESSGHTRDVTSKDSSSSDDDLEKQASDHEKQEATPSRYLEILKNPPIVVFALITFCYHMANAALVPLLAQYIAIISSDRSSLTWASAILLIGFFTQAITSYVMSSVVDKYNPKNITIVAFLILPLRCALISVMIVYWKNPWGLVATQVLDGAGAGVYDIMLPIIVKKLTVGSGRFGFIFGFIVTCWRIGHGVSLLVGEAVVHSYGYTAAFAVLGGVGVLNLLGFVTFFTFDDPSAAAEEEEPPKAVSEAEDPEEELPQSTLSSYELVKMSFTYRRSQILAAIASLRAQLQGIPQDQSEEGIEVDPESHEALDAATQHTHQAHRQALEEALTLEIHKLRILTAQEQGATSFSARRSQILASIVDLRSQIQGISEQDNSEEFVVKLERSNDLEQALAAEVKKLQDLNLQERDEMGDNGSKSSSSSRAPALDDIAEAP